VPTLIEPIVRPRRRTPAVCALVLAVALLVWIFDVHYRFFDMVIYHDAIRWWVNGGDLYAYAAPVRGELGFTYPPIAALLLMPVTVVRAATAGWVITAAGVAALAAVLAVLTTALADRHGWSRRSVVAVALPLALATEPVRQTLGLGQVNLLLFALVTLDLIVLGRAGSRWTGVGVGIAAAVKLTPGLFIGYLLVTRQWRAAGTATATAALLTGAGLLLFPAESAQYFGDLLWQTGRVGPADAVANQSLAGLLARGGGSGWWAAVAVAALLVGLYRARLAHAAGDEVTALTLTGLTANLVSPMSWTHHLVFLPVAVLVLADRALRERDPLPGIAAAAVYLLCVVSPIWLVPPGSTGAGAALARNSFVVTMVALVALLPAGPGRRVAPFIA